MYTPENVQLKLVREYNKSCILHNGNHGEHWLNEVKMVEYELATMEFDSLFQVNKFVKYSGF
jgi:hypothetical protein